MQILVTGSKGLIGYSLVSALRLLHFEVVGLDHRFSLHDVEYGDILDRKRINDLAESVDGIVHLAAVSRVIDGEKNPQLCFQTNVEGTRNVVEAALHSKKKPWIIFASSREVYGSPKTLPIHESFPLNPFNNYGKSKLEAEKIVNWGGSQGLITSIVRFSNVYGSIHDYPDRVIPAFCLAAATGENIQIEGEDHIFDFTYLEDVTQAILLIITQLIEKNTSLPPIHLCCGIGASIKEAARLAQQISEYPLDILVYPSRSFDVTHFCGDPNRAQKLLGWNAAVSLQEGMTRLTNQYRLCLRLQKTSFI